MSKWKTAKLGDHIEQIRGVSYKPRDVANTPTDGHIALLRANNIQEEGLNQDDLVYVAEARVSKKQILRRGDILVCASSGSKALVGKAAIANTNFEATFGAFCKVVRSVDLESRFLGHFFSSPSYRRTISGLSAGANINNIKSEHIDNLIVPLPPLKEQKRIADILDKAAELISLRKQQIEKLDLLVKSKFIDMFGDPVNGTIWKTVRIEAVCTLKSGSSLSAANENEGGEILYVKVGDMNLLGNEKYITTSSRSVSKKTAGRGIFPVGTVIFPKRGGAIGTNKKRLTKKEICADLNVMGVIPSEVISSEFLHAFFMTVDLGSLDNGSSVPQINNKDIGPLLIPFPPLKLQNEFATFVEKVEEQKAQMQTGVEKLEMNYKALMAECFAGEN